jgi:hypothetical protein
MPHASAPSPTLPCFLLPHRASGGVPRLLSLLSSIAHAAVRTLVLRLLASLSLEPVVLRELQECKAVPLLMQLLRQQALVAAKEEARWGTACLCLDDVVCAACVHGGVCRLRGAYLLCA